MKTSMALAGEASKVVRCVELQRLRQCEEAHRQYTLKRDNKESVPRKQGEYPGKQGECPDKRVAML